MSRLGLACRGTVYLLVGYLAFRLALAAHGRAGSSASSAGAVQAAVAPAWGRVPLVLLIAGLGAYALTQLTEPRCVELLDVAAAGIVLADQGGSVRTVAASDERARLLELFEVQNDESPCRGSYQLGAAVVNIDLDGARERWPQFAPQAIARGLRSANALPLRLRSQVIGSLNLSRADTGGLDGAEFRTAQALADAATIGILQQRTIRRGEVVAGQLQAALTSRIIIEQAKGVLAERLRISTDDAFAGLRAPATGCSQTLPARSRTAPPTLRN